MNLTTTTMITGIKKDRGTNMGKPHMSGSTLGGSINLIITTLLDPILPARS